jgi:hypothetical protein
MSFADRVLSFYKKLEIEYPLPGGVEVLNPYADETGFALCTSFYRKYYSDDSPRFMILGINPGRYGGGITGVPFTDPVKLEKVCGINNTLPKKNELSAEFIHAMIAAFGGVESFFFKFYINSVSPLGFIKDGKNVNYYDTPKLLKSLEPFIVASIKKQLSLGINTQAGFCLGEGENFRYLKKLNDDGKYFDTLIPLAHPRFIMQYKRKRVAEYIEDYLKKLNSVL